MAMQWFRFYGEAINDIKLRRIARDSGVAMATVLGIWTILLTLASNSPERGKLLISASTPATIDDISDIAGCNADVTLQKLRVTGLVTECNGVLCIAAWDKRQYESDDSAERVRKHRESAKNRQKDGNVTPVKRYSNVTVTPPDTESDTDTESEQSNSFAADAAAPLPTPPVVEPKEPKAKTPTAQSEMFGAVAECCQLDAKLQASRIGKTASALVGAGYTPEQVKSFAAWWRTNDWRAKTSPVPTMAQVTELIAQSLNGNNVIQASSNGYHSNNGVPTTKVGRSMAAVDRVQAMLEREGKL